MKHTLLINSLSSIQSDMKEAAIDMRVLYPNVDAVKQLDEAARVIGLWVKSIQQRNFNEEA